MNLFKSVSSTSLSESKKFIPPALLLVGFSLLFVAIVSAGPPSPLETPVSQRSAINPDEIAALDAEFGDLTDFGYFSGIESRRDTVSQRLEAGCGPLYEVKNYQLLIGKTGMAAVLTYATRGDDGLVLDNRPTEGGWPCLILLQDYVAPEAWWNRPVTSVYYDTETDFDGSVFPEIAIWVPWPDTASAAPCDTVAHATVPWYWDGKTYVEANYRAAIVAENGFLDVVPPSESLSP